MSQFPKHDNVVASAMADIGECERPMGSNSGPRVKTYQRATWLPGTGWPWCVAFLHYHWRSGGLQPAWKGAGAYALLDWARKNGHAVPLSEAVPGDAVVFNIGAGHAGMFLSSKGQLVKTVDGNVSDRVEVCERPVGLVRGYVHLPENPVPVPVTPPPYEVVTSISGHKRVVFNGKSSTIGKKLPRFLQRHATITIRRRKV